MGVVVFLRTYSQIKPRASCAINRERIDGLENYTMARIEEVTENINDLKKQMKNQHAELSGMMLDTLKLLKSMKDGGVS